jgi:hypothetical protein
VGTVAVAVAVLVARAAVARAGARYLLGTALALDASCGEHLAELLDFHALAVDLALLGERAAEECRREDGHGHSQAHSWMTRGARRSANASFERK